MDVLVTLIEAYEYKHYPIGPPDPVDAIKFRMEQQRLPARDLETYSGPPADAYAKCCAASVH